MVTIFTQMKTIEFDELSEDPIKCETRVVTTIPPGLHFCTNENIQNALGSLKVQNIAPSSCSWRLTKVTLRKDQTNDG